MKKLILLVSIMLLTTVTVIAQKWIVKNYLDDFGDPTNNMYVTQLVVGSWGENNVQKVRVVIDIDMPIFDQEFFRVRVFPSYGRLDAINALLNVEEIEPIFYNITYLFRYKIHGKERSLKINDFSTRHKTFNISRPALAHALLNSDNPIKCIITVKGNSIYTTEIDKNGKKIHTGMIEPQYYNLLNFILYPANFKEVYYRNK